MTGFATQKPVRALAYIRPVLVPVPRFWFFADRILISFPGNRGRLRSRWPVVCLYQWRGTTRILHGMGGEDKHILHLVLNIINI